MTRPIALKREQILAYRRTVGALDERLPPGSPSLRRAAWAGLQDSMPRAALLSIHARVEGTKPDALEDPSLVQLWGPRFSTYVVAAEDRAAFSLGRLPDDRKSRQFAEDLASRLESFLDGRTMGYAEAGRGIGVIPNALRYTAPTGRFLIRWEGARGPTIWSVPQPDVDPGEAGLELARRYLHVLGPTTAASFAVWAGIKSQRARDRFDVLAGSLTPVRTPIGDAWILAEDEPAFRAPVGPVANARLLPSGDAFWLLQGADRELLVADAARRMELWTPRVWPGAVLVDGEVTGTWRRAGAVVSVQSWRRFSASERDAVEREAASFPLLDVEGQIRVRWDG